jgi:hypothetical protein
MNMRKGDGHWSLEKQKSWILSENLLKEISLKIQ